MGLRRVALVVAVVLALVGAAHAGRQIAVGEVHAEADVADEAGAVTLLVHTALPGADATLVAIPDGLTLRPGDALTKANVTHAILMELSREGTGLRLTLAILGADGSRDVAFVRAGDGDVVALAQGVVTRAVATCGLSKREVPLAALGPLHAYAAALRVRDNPDAAAIALADALPITSLTVSAASKLLGAMPAKATTPAAQVVAARALRDNKKLTEISAGTDAIATAAKALLVISNRPEAEKVLATAPRHGLVTLAQVALAENGSDRARFEAKIKEGLIGDQVRPVLAIAASLVGSSISAGLHKALVTAAEKNRAPGVGARIGLNAAEANVEVNRALELISARELEDYDLTRLEKLVAKRTDPAALRLKAELSMRRADGLESATVAAYLAAAANDARAHRYQGWVLANDGKYAEAAVELGKAGPSARLEQARALLASGDPKAALVALAAPPKSAEELAIAAQVALLDKKVDEAATAISLAEKAGPVNPAVHRVILAVDAVKPEPDRATASKLLLEQGTGVLQKETKLAATGSAGSGSAEPTEKIENLQVKQSIDPALIEPLLASLTGLTQLQRRTIVLAQVKWEPSITSFKTVNAEPVKGAIIKVLSAPPYRLKIRLEPAKVADRQLTTTEAENLIADTNAVLLFRVATGEGGAEVTLSAFYKGESVGGSITRVIKAPGVIGFDDGKLKIILAFVGVIVAGGLVYLFRAKGRIKIKLEKAPDVDNEVLCVEISKSPTRPRVDDPQRFHKDTKAAGTITKARFATLIASGQVFKVGVGHWYVHVYGAFSRAGKMLVVPATCTQEVDLDRGQLAELKFELTSKLADVRVEVVANPRRGIAVWVASAEVDKVYTDDEGVAMLTLPVGNHTVIIEVKGKRFERPLQITAPKQQVLSINIERELRLGDGVALDLKPGDSQGELDNPHSELMARKPLAGAKTPPKAAGAPSGKRAATEPPAKLSSTRGTSSVDYVPPATALRPATAPVAPVMPSLSIGMGDSDLGAAGAQPKAAIASAATAISPDLAQPQVTLRKQPRAQTPRPGDTLLGRYRIVSELGRGAMGVVHRAWDDKLERHVAIKEMADDLRSNPDALKLFTQEAKALAQLNHTNIVAMYDQITDDSGVYMIMEFVDGRPLAGVIEEKGALPWRDAAAILDQVLSGLAYAHARKVIHRDIKPANIFVGTDKTVKIGDFGLARVMREVTIRRTEIRGTPLYMAPEQITGTNVDHRADLYATGCMLFELVTGRPPFIDGDILYAQMHLPPPSAGSMVEIPQSLDDLILSMLAKQSDDRPGSANEVRTSLKGVSGG